MKITRRADGKLTISGLDQAEYDRLVTGLGNSASVYRDSASRLNPGDLHDAMTRHADAHADMAAQLAPKASPHQRHIGG